MVRVLANVNSSKLAAMSLIWLDLYRSAATTIPIILMNWQFYVECRSIKTTVYFKQQ